MLAEFEEIRLFWAITLYVCIYVTDTSKSGIKNLGSSKISCYANY